MMVRYVHISQINVDNPQNVGAQGTKASEKPTRTEYSENLRATYCDILFISVSQLKRSLCLYLCTCTYECVLACLHARIYTYRYICVWMEARDHS